MNLQSFVASIALLAASATCFAAPHSIRDLKYEITDTAIVYPESQQADVHRLQQNWYLKNFTVLDTVGTADIPATNDVIIQRLQSLPTTIEMPFNPVVRSYIDLYTDRRRSLVETMLGLSLYYMPIFEEALEAEGLPLELRNLPIIESALDPNAVSRAGATGLWQFMLPTARGLGLEINTLVDQRRDPIAASRAAAQYLKQLYQIFGDWSLAIAAYNCGPGNINKALARAGASAENPKDYWDIYYHLPAETRGYVPGFIGATYAMAHYADHGISPALAKRPLLTDTVHITDRTYFKAISQVLDIPVEELRVLNPQYRQDIIPGDVHPYPLRLPQQMVFNYLMNVDSIASLSRTFGPRATVELGGLANQPQPGQEGTWRDVTVTHKVGRNETLSAIAAKYGVTTKQIKRWNKLSSDRLRRGTRLKIQTREFVPTPKPVATVDTIAAPPALPDSIGLGQPELMADSVAMTSPADSIAPKSVAAVDKPAEPAPAPKAKPAATANKPKVHRVVKGDTLFAIARKYGVTVDQLKRANNLSSTALSIGQRLTIPKK